MDTTNSRPPYLLDSVPNSDLELELIQQILLGLSAEKEGRLVFPVRTAIHSRAPQSEQLHCRLGQLRFHSLPTKIK